MPHLFRHSKTKNKRIYKLAFEYLYLSSLCKGYNAVTWVAKRRSYVDLFYSMAATSKRSLLLLLTWIVTTFCRIATHAPTWCKYGTKFLATCFVEELVLAFPNILPNWWRMLTQIRVSIARASIKENNRKDSRCCLVTIESDYLMSMSQRTAYPVARKTDDKIGILLST